MTTIQKKIQKKVEEINKLISLASNSESENAYDGNLMVVDAGSSWQEPMVYKPIKFTNGVLYIEYYEPYSQKTTKEKILSKNLELDGYGTLLDIAKMYRKALKSENITFAYGGSLIGNQKRIDLNKNGKIDAEDFKLLRSSMNGASRNERKHVNHNEDYEVRYAKNKPTRTGYKGKRNFALGGSLENHGLKKGDRIIKTIDGGIQQVKDKDGKIVYVNLANGERSADVPLPFNDGGEVTYFVNKDGIRVRSKVEPKNRPTEKEWMAKHNESREARTYAGGGKVSFAEKSREIAKNFEGKRVEPKYQKEYGKTYDKAEAKEVGNKIAGAQKAKYDAKMAKGGVVEYTDGYFEDNSEYTSYPYTKVINDYFNKWDSIKTEKDSENFKKLNPPMFGTYKNKDILEQISIFENLNIPFEANEIKRNDFKKEISKIISMKSSKAEKGAVVKKKVGNPNAGQSMLLAKKIRKDGEKWTDAVKRASAMLKAKK